MRVAQSGMGTTPQRLGSIADGTGSTEMLQPRVGSIRIGAPSGARSFASDLGVEAAKRKERFLYGGLHARILDPSM